MVNISLLPALSLVLVLASTSAHGAVFNSKAVKQLTGTNFKRTVQGSDKLTVAAFVAPWCGHCQKLAPEYDRVAENLKGLVNIVAVDCDEDKNKGLCGELGIKGFPTLKVFPGGSAPSQSYGGARTAKAIVEYATSRMPTFVKKAASSSEVEALRALSAEKPISLLFTSAALVTPLYKALSTDFYKTVDFYAARESKIGKETMAAFGVDKVPALVVLRGDKVDKYDGPLKYDAIHAFLKPFASAKPSPRERKDEL